MVAARKLGRRVEVASTRTELTRVFAKPSGAPSGGARDVTVAASIGTEAAKDEDQFAGMIREQVIYNGVDTKPVFKTVNVPWMSPATAFRTINGDTVTAQFTNIRVRYQATALSADGAAGWRTTRTESQFDDTDDGEQRNQCLAEKASGFPVSDGWGFALTTPKHPVQSNERMILLSDRQVAFGQRHWALRTRARPTRYGPVEGPLH